MDCVTFLSLVEKVLFIDVGKVHIYSRIYWSLHGVQ